MASFLFRSACGISVRSCTVLPVNGERRMRVVTWVAGLELAVAMAAQPASAAKFRFVGVQEAGPPSGDFLPFRLDLTVADHLVADGGFSFSEICPNDPT